MSALAPLRPRRRALASTSTCTFCNASPRNTRSFSSPSLRLTPQSRTRLANASFMSAFLLSILTVAYLSGGNNAGSLPCPARPGGTGQRADAGDTESIRSGRTQHRIEEQLPDGRSRMDDAPGQKMEEERPQQRFVGLSGMVAQYIQDWKRR